MSTPASALTRRDHVVVGFLVLLLALIAAAIAAPAFEPVVSGEAPIQASPSPGATTTPRTAIRIGVLGTADGVNPLGADTRAEQDLVALVFSGLVKLGPGQSVVPDLASAWTTSADGKTWIFTLRDDAQWHDGEPVTARDVLFTVGVLRDPAWTGAGAESWRDVTATAVGPRSVQFVLSAPIGGFLQAATQPILPAHRFEGVPVAEIADAPANREPVGSGPYRLTSLSEANAHLVPAGARPAPLPTATPPEPGDPGATVPLPPLPPAVVNAEAELDLRFFSVPSDIAAAYENGEIDLATDVAAADALRLAGSTDSRLLRYPSSTLTAVMFNLRPSRPAFRDFRARYALLRAINRQALAREAWHGQAVVADGPIPRASWAFDPTATRPVAYDLNGAARAFTEAGWTKVDDRWVAPGGTAPFELELLSPDVASNPDAFLAAASVAGAWQGIGLNVTHRPLGPAELVGRLRTANFAAAVLDINIGLDPDLYPLLGTTQTTSRGLNLSGLVDPELDKLLVAARAPGTDAVRRAAYKALQVRLTSRQYLLPLAFRDELVVARDTVQGPLPRQVGGPGDRFWDVLSWRLAGDG